MKEMYINRIVIVILHYGDYTVTDACVQSICGLRDRQRLSVVIVDNDVNRPESERNSFRYKYQNNASVDSTTVLTNHGKGGFSEANNLGYRYAREKLGADCILIINNDISFTQYDFIRRLEGVYREHPCHILSPWVERADTHEPQSPMDTRLRTREEAQNTIRFNRLALRLMPASWPALRLWEKVMERQRLRGKAENLQWYHEPHTDIIPFGACLLFMPLFTEREENAFDPETGFYYEEYILAARCARKGYEITYDPRLRVQHRDGSATRSTYRRQVARMKFTMRHMAESCEVYLGELSRTEKQKHSSRATGITEKELI